jgi:hypothetical protein
MPMALTLLMRSSGSSTLTVRNVRGKRYGTPGSLVTRVGTARPAGGEGGSSPMGSARLMALGSYQAASVPGR